MRPSSVFAFFAAITSLSVSADKLVKFCEDERGNPYFTDSTCLNNKAALQRFWVSSAPSYHYEVSPGADRMVREWRHKQYRHLRSERAAPPAPTWADRQAARNADVSIRAQREMYRHRKSGPRDAAEMAIQYNMESVAGGGRHQVRVPDVTTVNVHGRRGRGSTVIVPRSSGSRRGAGAPSGYLTRQPSWADRQAARNADVAIRAERDMYRHRKSGPRDAAEMAIQYNVKNVAGGGTHQVEVPDVTNVNIYEDRIRR